MSAIKSKKKTTKRTDTDEDIEDEVSSSALVADAGFLGVKTVYKCESCGWQKEVIDDEDAPDQCEECGEDVLNEELVPLNTAPDTQVEEKDAAADVQADVTVPDDIVGTAIKVDEEAADADEEAIANKISDEDLEHVKIDHSDLFAADLEEEIDLDIDDDLGTEIGDHHYSTEEPYAEEEYDDTF